ncbi:unnamed protein product [Caenorhabditis angaria]|uniref:Uncharacterized protein n=1 Tax=Caenorhabditis angaria TaxID=860376 RepID=A0A9P1IEF6_9PELO|nr:unnamed protein product [Caenorhabditis angaria]
MSASTATPTSTLISASTSNSLPSMKSLLDALDYTFNRARQINKQLQDGSNCKDIEIDTEDDKKASEIIIKFGENDDLWNFKMTTEEWKEIEELLGEDDEESDEDFEKYMDSILRETDSEELDKSTK